MTLTTAWDLSSDGETAGTTTKPRRRPYSGTLAPVTGPDSGSGTGTGHGHGLDSPKPARQGRLEGKKMTVSSSGGGRVKTTARVLLRPGHSVLIGFDAGLGDCLSQNVLEA